MIQSITYLQYGLDDLKQEVEKQLEENVLLEREHKEIYSEEFTTSKNTKINDSNIFNENGDNKLENIERKNEFSIEDWKSHYENQGQNFEGYKARNSDYDELYDPDKKGKDKNTLKSHLLEQANILFENDIDKRISELLIENINFDGFLDEFINIYSEDLNEKNERYEVSKENIFEYIKNRINSDYDNNVVDEEDIKDVLEQIYTFDPVGCGAFSKLETLYIQAKYYEYDDYIVSIIKDDLNLLADNKIKEIKDKYDIPDSKLLRAIELIKNLEPIPGRIFYPELPQNIEPEIRLIKEDNNYRVELITERIPSLKISNYYRKKILDPNTDSETKEYIEGKIEAAMNIINAIKQRKSTIIKVMEVILKIQKDFFDSGGNYDYFKAITLKDIAQEVELDESTVSRATSGKYLISDIGLFELKHFFSTSVKVTGGENQSMKYVKNLISKIIDLEDKKSPLSDAKISDILKKEYNLNILRKTIGNYRKDMDIPSTTRRKKIL
jgi:RNA polymerase sigma-54 factor